MQKSLQTSNFNPRPREEGDLTVYTKVSSVHISIHALVKRATAKGGYHATEKGYFNPRPREEGDCFTLETCLVVPYFNPRPREEGDRTILAWYNKNNISIHALVKRATFVYTFIAQSLCISIHALVKRATLFVSVLPVSL